MLALRGGFYLRKTRVFIDFAMEIFGSLVKARRFHATKDERVTGRIFNR